MIGHSGGSSLMEIARVVWSQGYGAIQIGNGSVEISAGGKCRASPRKTLRIGRFGGPVGEVERIAFFVGGPARSDPEHRSAFIGEEHLCRLVRDIDVVRQEEVGAD